MVRARFKVVSIEIVAVDKHVTIEPDRTVAPFPRPDEWKREWRRVKAYNIRLVAVTGKGNDEQSRFFAATPCGELKLQIVDEKAASQFEIDREYFLEFIPVIEESPAS